MQVAFHLGAPCSGDDALYASLHRSRAVLARHSVAIAGPDEATGGRPPCQSRDGRVLHKFREKGVRRVLFCESCSAELLGFSSHPVGDGLLYPLAGQQAETLAMLFEEEELEFHLAVRSPVTLLPTLVCQGDPAAVELAANPRALAGLSWADVVLRLRRAAPGAMVVVWCDEDMPLIWPEVVERVAGISGTGESGFLDRLAHLLTEDGLDRLQLYLSSHPPRDAEQRRSIVSSYLTRFGKPEAIEMELDLPGWTPEAVAAISDAYDADVERIAAMENVELIQP